MFMAQPQPSDGFEWTQAPWGAVLRCRPLLAVADHFFTGANLALRDDREEWLAVAREIGVDLEHLLLLRQVHSAKVVVARHDRSSSGARPEADVIVSDDPASAIAVRVADCAPVLLGDRRLGVVGAAHAGWRGTVQGAAPAAVRAMQETFGSNPADLVVAIGPCLGVCCGEVGPEVLAAFRDAGHSRDSLARWFTPGTRDRSYLNLPFANRDQVASAGVPASQIHVSGLCTRTFADVFHSYRAARERAGRMVGIIRVNPEIADR
jgi:YfiH family protein